MGLWYDSSQQMSFPSHHSIVTDNIITMMEPGIVCIRQILQNCTLQVGAPTWNTGADSERSGTGWDDVLNDISGKCATRCCTPPRGWANQQHRAAQP